MKTEREVHATQLQKGKLYADVRKGIKGHDQCVFEFIEARTDNTIVMKKVSESDEPYESDTDGNVLFTNGGNWYEVD